MSALPSSAVTIGDGEITIADPLALKLGLSVKVLKSEMRRGCVYSVTEQGMTRTRGARASPSAIAPALGPWWSSRTAPGFFDWAVSGSAGESGLNDRQDAQQAFTSISEQET